MITTVIVCILAGLGAGLGTGFAGMSAAAVISPMLITFLGMDPYQAIGIALASDVLASAVSSYEYGKRSGNDVHCHDFYLYCQLPFQIYLRKYYGKLFHFYDYASRY